MSDDLINKPLMLGHTAACHQSGYKPAEGVKNGSGLSVRAERIASLRECISSGEYVIDIDLLAKRLMSGGILNE